MAMAPMQVASRAFRATSFAALMLLSAGAFAAGPELVLQENARLTATTPSGTLSIVAGQRFVRTYEWDGCSLEAEMYARSQRWYGALGIRSLPPGSALFPSLQGCKGIWRPVVEEAQLHFPDRGAAERWIAWQPKVFESVWSNDGLFLQWGVAPSRHQISVYLMQICIAGKKPTQLAGASDEAIGVKRVTGSEALRFDCEQNVQ